MNDRTMPWRTPPIWLRVLGLPLAVVITWAMAEHRGAFMAVVTGIVYGTLALGSLAWDGMVAWSRAHPLLDSLVHMPLLFVALALVTPWSLVVCAAITVVVGPALALLGYYLSRRRRAAAG